MGDGIKLSRDKRHRSSSSLAGIALEGTRSERKLDKNASIPELDDQFSIAEVRCDDLQEKLDLIKTLKKKKKLKKRSTTRITDPPKTPENIPFITVRTQPKKKVSQQAARRRLEIPPNPTRGYLDPATVEQHRMIGQVRGYNHTFKHPHQERGHFPTSSANHRPYVKLKRQRSHADGDSMCSQGCPPSEGQEPCGQIENGGEFTNFDVYNQPAENSPAVSAKKPAEVRQVKQTTHRRRHVPKDVPPKEERAADHWLGPQGEMPTPRRRQPSNKILEPSANQHMEERSVVELFNKHRTNPASLQRHGTAPMIPTPMIPVSAVPAEKKLKKIRNTHKFDDECHDALETNTSMDLKHAKESAPHPRRIKYRSRRYEMPTVASQMKHTGMRNYYDSTNHTNIPFVVTKSTAPSHNIGVNIQQVLNGLKIQQPLSGIPLTIAHHMGLGHVPKYGTKSTNVNQQPSLDHYEINAIRVGRRLVRLPSYKYISYNRLLNLYREGDGMVPRFLRAIARPHYFYTSMYNLATNREDFDCATSKGRAGSHEAKQSLAEYASLYREYEHIDKCIREGNCEPELERRKEDLTKELAAREEHIRKVVQEYRTGGEPDQPLRASASTAEGGYRHSTFKVGYNQQ